VVDSRLRRCHYWCLVVLVVCQSHRLSTFRLLKSFFVDVLLVGVVVFWCRHLLKALSFSHRRLMVVSLLPSLPSVDVVFWCRRYRRCRPVVVV
ncbi:2499_t:CDS:2, partial [Scutellospora calospora]